MLVPVLLSPDLEHGTRNNPLAHARAYVTVPIGVGPPGGLPATEKTEKKATVGLGSTLGKQETCSWTV